MRSLGQIAGSVTIAGDSADPENCQVGQKQSLYFPEAMLKEISDEATRQDRSLSWIVQKDWKAARKEIRSMQAVNDFPGGDG